MSKTHTGQFFKAIKERSTADIDAALAAGADINALSTNNELVGFRRYEHSHNTGLHLASESPDITVHLLSKGADQAIRNLHDALPIEMASPDVRKILLEDAQKIAAHNEDKAIHIFSHALTAALKYNDLAMAQEVFDAIPLSIQRGGACLPKSYTIDKLIDDKNVTVDTLGWMHDHGVTFETLNEETKGTYLHFTTAIGDDKKSRFMVEVVGLDINAVDKYINTPLHCLAMGKHHKNSFVDNSSQGDRVGLAHFLVSKGAKRNAKNEDKQIPSDLARDEELKAFLKPSSWFADLTASITGKKPPSPPAKGPGIKPTPQAPAYN